jgi:predicted lipid carrier protein YhbT
MPEPGAATAVFLEDLASRGEIPLLHNMSGTIRIDLIDGGRTTHWYLTVEKGTVAVSHRNTRADAVIHGSVELFDKLATGRANATASMLRGTLTVEGNLGLMSGLERVLPGPPGSRATYLERQKEAAR